MGAGAPARGDDRSPQVPDLKVETYTLPNGLEVILHEDHTTPVVAVNVWYKVGSKDEKKGRTGFAHLFEHLMFEGSQHCPGGYDEPVEKLGARNNASTSEDRTNYFITLPSNALERALWLESDRMGFLLPALTQADLDNQRDVVKNERRQRVDNQPYGQSHEKLDEALYPDDHPYHHSVIGSMADLSAASLDDVSAFFRTYYAPDNASLCIAGDIDPAKTKALVEKYFGPLPRGPEITRPKPDVPKLGEQKHLKLTDRVTLPMARLVWPTVPLNHPDEPRLDVLAVVLGQLDKENRLFKALEYDRQLAARVSASTENKLLSGTFDVMLLARPGQGLDELVQIADAEIDRLKADGPTADEVRKAQNMIESQLILGLESVEHRADFLNSNSVERGGPLAYKRQMAALFAVTPADVKRVANQYLTAGRVRVDVTPGSPTPRAPEAAVDPKSQAPMARPPALAVKDTYDRSKMPEVGPAPKFTPPAVVRRTLSNGLEVLVAERHGLPIVSLELVVKGGETLVPAEKHGLASMTAALLTEGTATRDALTLAGALAEIGASIDTEGGLEASTAALTTLTRHTARALELYTDVLLHPAFPQKELDRVRLQRLARIRARSDRAESIAGVVFDRLLYGDAHPYGRPDLGTLKSVAAITRADVAAFHKRLYLPNNASLIVVGDTTPDAITAALEAALKDWKPGEPPKATLPEPPPPPKGVTVHLVDKPDAAQSYLAVGQVGVPRSTPDYVPLTVLNAVLGGEFSSRINTNLREEKGYTYGAHTRFAFRQGPGPFQAGTAVQTSVTKEALAELVKEISDITGPRPVTDAELADAKERIVGGFPARFETTSGVAGTLVELVLYNLPDDYFATFPARVGALTKADVARAAKEHLNPDRLTILVVGDRAKVEGPLKTLPYARVINALDPDGNPLPAASGAEHGQK
jgi:zinc protease